MSFPGNNLATESGVPRSWVWNKQDLRNIRAIHRQFGRRKILSYPTLGTLHWLWLRWFHIIRFIPILDYVPYQQKQAMSTLEQELKWRYYGGKHYESIFTKFYQAYVLPVKFHIDKKRAHLSSLIRNGEISREDALKKFEDHTYKENELESEKRYVIKKLGLSEEEFKEIMSKPIRDHLDYPSDFRVLNWLRGLANFFGIRVN